MIGAIIWIMDYWSVLIWAVPFLIILGFVWHWFGRRMALPVGVVMSALIMYILGKKIERDSYQKHVQDIKEKREEAYEKINSRNTGPADVHDRLHRGDF